MILIVNQHTVPVFTDVVNAFAATGVETRLFTGHIERGRASLSSLVRKISSIRYNRRSGVTRLLTWTLFSAHYFFYLAFSKRPSHILVVTNPPMAPFVTSLIARLRGVPFYVVVFDLYPEVLQQAGVSSDSSWIYRIWQNSNHRTFAKAAGLFTLSESMKQAVTKYIDGSKVRVIFNWADIEYIKPVEKHLNPFVAKHNLAGKLVVMYSGNMGFTHDLESLIDAAVLLSTEDRVRFVLIGDGAKRKKLEMMCDRNQLQNVLFLPYQDAESFPFAMAAADVGIITLGTGGEGISVPSKTYVNMAAGLAIIAISPPNSELNRIVEQFSLGYVVAPGEPRKIADHIRILASDSEMLRKYKSNSRTASLSFTSANAKEYVRALLGESR